MLFAVFLALCITVSEQVVENTGNNVIRNSSLSNTGLTTYTYYTIQPSAEAFTYLTLSSSENLLTWKPSKQPIFDSESYPLWVKADSKYEEPLLIVLPTSLVRVYFVAQDFQSGGRRAISVAFTDLLESTKPYSTVNRPLVHEFDVDFTSPSIVLPTATSKFPLLLFVASNGTRTESTEPTIRPTTKPTEPTEPTEPTTRPTEPTTKPTEPTEPTEPTTKPTEPTEPTEPTTKPTEPTEPTTRPTEPTEPTTKPTDPTEPTEPTTKPTEPTEPTTVLPVTCSSVRGVYLSIDGLQLESAQPSIIFTSAECHLSHLWGIYQNGHYFIFYSEDNLETLKAVRSKDLLQGHEKMHRPIILPKGKIPISKRHIMDRMTWNEDNWPHFQ